MIDPKEFSPLALIGMGFAGIGATIMVVMLLTAGFFDLIPQANHVVTFGLAWALIIWVWLAGIAATGVSGLIVRLGLDAWLKGAE